MEERLLFKFQDVGKYTLNNQTAFADIGGVNSTKLAFSSVVVVGSLVAMHFSQQKAWWVVSRSYLDPIARVT